MLRFLGDDVGPTKRMRAAAELAQLPSRTAIAVDAEPAPYSLPPVNLFDWQVVLVPRSFEAKPGEFPGPTLLVRPIDAPRRHWLDDGWWLLPRERSVWDAGLPTRMSWAGKDFEAVEVGTEEGVSTP